MEDKCEEKTKKSQLDPMYDQVQAMYTGGSMEGITLDMSKPQNLGRQAAFLTEVAIFLGFINNQKQDHQAVAATFYDRK